MQEKDKLDKKHMEEIKNIKYSPIFIMGLHRSGTSILYEILHNTGFFNKVNAYHILCYDQLIYNHVNKLEKQEIQKINNIFNEKNIKTRKFDQLNITPDFAQEYVYLFRAKNKNEKINDSNIYLFDSLCKKIQFISENNKPILLKNPSDFPNFLYMKNKFPDAKFVFIHRNPLAVISSTLRAWRSLLTEKNPYTSLFSDFYNKIFDNPLILSFMRWFYSSKTSLGLYQITFKSKKALDFYQKNIKKLSDNDYVSIRYENLCKDPNQVINNVLGFLNLETKKDFSDFIKPRGLDLLPEIKKIKGFLKRKIPDYLKKYGYDF